MTYVRHSARKLAWTLERNLRAWLDAQGWITPPIVFNTSPVQVTTRRIPESELTAITGNLLGIFHGPEANDEPIQLGGGYQMSSSQVYIDVVASSEAIGLALASDVKDYLSGRPPGTSRFFNLRDFDTDPAGVPLPEWLVEVASVTRQRPENTQVKAFWQVLVADLELTFPGDD